MRNNIPAAAVFGSLGALVTAAVLWSTILPAFNIAGDPTGPDALDLRVACTFGGVGAIAFAWSMHTLVRAFLFRPYPRRLPTIPRNK